MGCNHPAASGEPAAVSRFFIMILSFAALLSAVAGSAATQPIVPGEPFHMCESCCPDGGAACSAVFEMCDRACAAAIVPSYAAFVTVPRVFMQFAAETRQRTGFAMALEPPPPRTGA